MHLFWFGIFSVSFVAIDVLLFLCHFSLWNLFSIDLVADLVDFCCRLCIWDCFRRHSTHKHADENNNFQSISLFLSFFLSFPVCVSSFVFISFDPADRIATRSHNASLKLRCNNISTMCIRLSISNQLLWNDRNLSWTIEIRYTTNNRIKTKIYSKVLFEINSDLMR